MIFNLGAPSQLDPWDMKPDAPAEIRGPFKPVATRSLAFRSREILPRHAALADKFSLVRCCTTTAPAVHDAGWQMMQTGRLFTGGVNTPHVGCVVSYLMGRKTDLPSLVVLPELMGRGGGNLPNGQAGGFLGKAHDPFALNADPSKPNFKVPDLLPPQGDRRRPARPPPQAARHRRRHGRDRSRPARTPRLLDRQLPVGLPADDQHQAREAFDLSKEPQETRERYGMNRFGQCCLLARRLIESGVRFVTINTFLTVFNEITWDIHGSKPFTSIEGMRDIVCPMYDQAYTALIEDLDQRGMLDATLVCNLAEFGRTPRVNPAGGRDHWPQCFTVDFAGGGVKGGRVVGASDPIGAVPADRPVEPADVAATIFHSLGLDLETNCPAPPAGRSRWSISAIARSTNCSE